MKLITPSPDLAQVNWTHNHFANPSFELWGSSNYPVALSRSKSMERYHWYNYTEKTEGARSAGFQCRSLDGDWSYAFYEHRYIAADATNLTLKFDWWLDQNFDHVIDHDFIYLYLDFTQGYQMLYYLNGSEFYSFNTTSSGVFLLGGPEKQWNLFDRNITADFLSIPDFPTSIPTGLQLENLKFYMRARGGTKEYVRALIDDVQLVNATTTYIGGSTRNGNFESDPYQYNWRIAGNNDPGLHTASPLTHSGSWSLNLTSLSNGNSSYTTCGYNPDVRLTTLNPANLQFWWRLEDVTHPTNETNAFVELQCYNSTDDWETVYFLSHGGSLPNPNYLNETYRSVFYADNFNTTGSWNLFSRDLLADIATRFPTDELFINSVTFYLELDDSPSSRIVLLVDDVSLNSAAVNGMGYEDQPAVGENVRGWYDNNDYDELTVTDVAYAGSKAANLTVTTGNVYALQEPAYRPVNGTRETYFDFVWRLEEYTPGSWNFVRFSVEYGERSIDYMLAVSSTFPWTNSSSHVYLNVTSIGTTGTWTQCHIDLVHDYEAAFGVTPNTNITYFYFEARCDSGGRIEILWDDFFLYDDPAPILGNVNQTPTTPEYDDTVDITADASDQDLHMALLHYRVVGGSWHTVVMDYQSGDTFQGTIPSQPYGATVEYYVTANDTWGMTTTALDNGQYYSYSVGDATGPSISIIVNDVTLVSENIALPSLLYTAYGGIVNITSTVTDPGSGVASVEIAIESIVVFSGVSEPFTYLWPSNLVYSGTYTVSVTAIDNAGNSQTTSVSFMVQNPLPQILIAAVVITVVIVVVVVLFLWYRSRKQPEQ